MQVVAGGIAGGTHCSDCLACADGLACAHIQRRTMHIYGRQTVSMGNDDDYEGGTNVVDVYISYLRKKIDGGQKKKLIHTVRGMGYVLKEG